MMLNKSVKPSSPADRNKKGFTILEMMVTISIMTILASTIALSWASLRSRAERVGCTFHLQALYVCFDAYCTDNGHWPQVPDDVGEEGHEFFNVFMKELIPYGGDRSVWICPRERRAGTSHETDKKFTGSYIPTQFDARADTPWMWNQPWLIERVDNHEVGQLMILPDGTIQTLSELRMGM
ncbi:MAG: prepilin-type N-terminal cleavage/methylation domain-containing protein [Verrucomicrobiales bacterium]|jgi:prepilin-type N-terminal cleavage/methylation domain-containing protein